MKDIEKTITVEGVEIKIDTCFGDSQCLIEFAPVDAISEYCAAGREGIDPWSVLLGFKAPRCCINNNRKRMLVARQRSK